MSAASASSGGVRPLERGHPWDARFCDKSPLFWPLQRVASFFASHNDWPSIAELDAALWESSGVHFHEQPPRVRRRRRGRRLPIEADSLYDARIHLSGAVPTRPNNWHDFLNALVWATFPRAKHVFHARQYAAVTSRIDEGARVLPGTRTRELDGLAILDEGGMILLVETALEQQMAEWIDEKNLDEVRRATGDRRAAAILFGHALYETLLGGNAAATWAMVTILPCPDPLPGSIADRIKLADDLLAARLLEPGTFANPDTFRNLPLDERILCPGTNP